MIRLFLFLTIFFGFSSPALAQELELSAPEQSCIMMDNGQRYARLNCAALDERVEAAALALAKSEGDEDYFFGCFIIGNPEGCFDLAELAFDESDKDTHLPALLLAERGCRSGHYDSCDTAFTIIEAMPVLRDRDRILDAICKKGGDEACYSIKSKPLSNTALTDCIGLPKASFDKKKICAETEETVKNYALNYAIENGEGESFVQCFSLDDGDACRDLASIILDPSADDTVDNDSANLWLYSRACRLGATEYCDDQVWLMTNIKTFNGDRSAFARLCKSGIAAACDYAPAAPKTQAEKKKREQIYWAVDYFKSTEK